MHDPIQTAIDAGADLLEKHEAELYEDNANANAKGDSQSE